MPQVSTINISTRTILKVAVIVLGLLFLYQVKQVLVIVFVALVLSAALDPSITSLERRGIPRPLGIAVYYAAIVGIVSLLVILFVPLVTDQLDQLSRNLPSFIARGSAAFQHVQGQSAVSAVQKTLSSLSSTFSNLTQNVFSGVLSFFGGLFSLIGILVLTFYMTMEEKGIKRLVVDIASAQHRPYLTKLFGRIEDRLGQWLRGQLFLGLIIAVLTYVGLLLMQVKFALILALIAGVTELIPIVGPLIGAVPAVIVAAGSGHPIQGLYVAFLYLIIQQLENHLIVPRVMSKATGLNPIIVIIALLVGAKLAGVTGVILAVPTVIMVTTYLDDFLEEKSIKDTTLDVA